jgi:excisionase family DNA binding protein
MSDLPKLLTLDEVAEILSVSRRTLNVWVLENRIPIRRIGPRSPRVAVGDLHRFLDATLEPAAR